MINIVNNAWIMKSGKKVAAQWIRRKKFGEEVVVEMMG